MTRGYLVGHAARLALVVLPAGLRVGHRGVVRGVVAHRPVREGGVALAADTWEYQQAQLLWASDIKNMKISTYFLPNIFLLNYSQVFPVDTSDI